MLEGCTLVLPEAGGVDNSLLQALDLLLPGEGWQEAFPALVLSPVQEGEALVSWLGPLGAWRP